MHSREEIMASFGRFLDVLDELREKCPWDRKQTNHSLRPNTIEECFELCDALIADDTQNICKELGDVLLHVAFYAKIASEKQQFDMKDVCDRLCDKLIYRHPHVFGTVEVENSADVLKNWEAIKTEEKQRNTLVEKLRAIPPMMPALMRATKVAKMTDAANPPSSHALIASLEEQIALLKAQGDASDEETRKYIGALLMGACRLCGQLGVDAELALSRETDLLIEKTAENCK